MTGIERLNKLIADIDVSADPELWYILRWGTEGDWDCEEHDDKTLGSTLAAIADQIERERGGRVSLMRVLAVVTDMERHVSGVEGMEDSPVARWARELREALGGNGRDPAADVSVSAYDLLPQEDREAIAWVRDHGGLDYVKSEWRSRVPYDRYERRRQRLLGHIAECETALGRRREIISKLAHHVKALANENVELRRRAMPEGMEWLLEVWPRWSNGEYCRFGDWWTADRYGDYEPRQLRRLVIYTPELLDEWEQGDGKSYGYEWDFMRPSELDYRPDKVEPPAPSVLAADGEPLEVGQTVWDTDAEADTPLTVVEVSSDLVRCEYTWKDGKTYRPCYPPDQLTHQRPDSLELIADEIDRLREEVALHLGDYLYDEDGNDSIQFSMELVAKRCRALAERDR